MAALQAALRPRTGSTSGPAPGSAQDTLPSVPARRSPYKQDAPRQGQCRAASHLTHHPHAPRGREPAGAGTARGENAKPGWSPDRHAAPLHSPTHPLASSKLPESTQDQDGRRHCWVVTGKVSLCPLKSLPWASFHFSDLLCVLDRHVSGAVRSPGTRGGRQFSGPALRWQLSCREICEMDPKISILKRT